MHYARSFFIAAGVCLMGVMSAVGQHHVLHSRQEWLQANLLFGKEDGLGFRVDMSTRHVDGLRGMSQYLLRAGLTYSLPIGIQAVTGLATIRYFDDGMASRIEWRPYQDLVRPTTQGKTTWQQRLRIEPRFLRSLNRQSNAAANSFQLRLRYRLQCQWRLAELSRSHPERQLLLAIGDEIMVNPVHGSDQTFYSTNRLMLTPTLRWGPVLDIALVLNHQYTARHQPSDFESAEVLWLNITRRFGAAGRHEARRG